jgi:hypothetical protein
MRWHMKPCSEKVLEDSNIVCLRLRHRLRGRGLTISLGKILSLTLQWPNVGFCNLRWPKVITDPGQCHHCYNLQASRVVKGHFDVSRIAGSTHTVRIRTARGTSSCWSFFLLVRQRFFSLLHWSFQMMCGDLSYLIRSHRLRFRRNRRNLVVGSKFDVNHARAKCAWRKQ